MSIFINKEMRALIPPLSEEELDQLEANVLAEGIRDPLVTWPQPDGREMLIDGHNRFDISCRHNGIPFKVVRKEFADMDEAKAWVIRNQFGRRNLSAYDRSVLALKLKPLIAEQKEKNLHLSEGAGNKGVQKSAQVSKGKTRDELAKIAGVSHDTIHRVEAIEKEAREDTKQLIREGKLSINQAYNAIHPPKSPRQSMKEFMDRKRQEHEDFKEKKTVSIDDIQKDKETTELIVTDLYTRLLRMGKRIDEICFDMEAGDIDLKELGRTLPKDKADFLQITIRDTRNKLLKIEMEVYGDR